jgi:hypothetical protein
MKTKHFQIALSFVALVSLACTCSALPDLTAIANDLATPTASASGGGSTSTKVAPAPTTSGGGSGAQPTKGKFDTVFPLPASVKNFTGTGGESSVNFQTDMSLKDTIAFYKKAFADMGLKERTANTAVTDSTFSFVFDGYKNGKAIVIQGVALGANSTNVNIRFESL